MKLHEAIIEFVEWLEEKDLGEDKKDVAVWYFRSFREI